MVGSGGFRRQQQKDQVDRLIVDRLERDRALQPGKDAVQLGEPGQLAVRDRNPVPIPVLPSLSVRSAHRKWPLMDTR